MRKFFYIILLLAFSRPAFGQITLYKDKNVMTLGVFTNSIDDFRWAFKSENIFDSLVFYGEHEENVKRMILNLEKLPNYHQRMGSPRYAFILDYNSIKDTLYFYDFNAEDYETVAYLSNNDIFVRDTKDKLRKYLLMHFNNFVRREYFYMSDSDKEYYYIKRE